MLSDKSIRDACCVPNPRVFIVTNADGKPMGRMNLTDSFGPVPLQFCACFPLVDAAQVAEQIGGIVRPAPIFDKVTKEWVIPALDSHVSQ